MRVSISLDADHHRGRHLDHEYVIHKSHTAARTPEAQVGFERTTPAVVQDSEFFFLWSRQCLHVPSLGSGERLSSLPPCKDILYQL